MPKKLHDAKLILNLMVTKHFPEVNWGNTVVVRRLPGDVIEKIMNSFRTTYGIDGPGTENAPETQKALPPA